MANEKPHSHEDDNVYKKGNKYYCTECHQEVPVKQACHTCKREIDWDRVLIESRH
jgi:hypothetical protein